MISIWCTRGEAARAAASRPPPMPSAQRGATRLRPTPAACARAAPRRLRCHAAPLPDGHPKRAAPLRRQPRRTPQPTPLTSEGASLDARASQRASGSRRTPREAPGALCKCRRTHWPSRFSASRQSAVPILGLSPHCEKHAVAMGGRCHCSETQTLRIRQTAKASNILTVAEGLSPRRAVPRRVMARCAASAPLLVRMWWGSRLARGGSHWLTRAPQSLTRAFTAELDCGYRRDLDAELALDTSAKGAIGAGGQGVVRLATRRSDDARFAVKSVPKSRPKMGYSQVCILRMVQILGLCIGLVGIWWCDQSAI